MAESDEVVDNYRRALEELTGNQKYEIGNLTMIARESTEHAYNIADVVVENILTTPPQKKLPALYVLDSIVKNVGSPYTVFFSQNLYKAFMEAYAMVGNSTRQKMEEMLRTWKEPVPGSIDRRPVFEPETVQPIENALMKVRGAVPTPNRVAAPPTNMPPPPHTQQPGPYGGPPPPQYPPTNGVGQAPHPGYQYPPKYSAPQSVPPVPAAYPPAPTNPYGGPPPPPQYARPGVINVGDLSRDIAALIEALKAEASRNPHDEGVKVKLGALGDLQTVLQMSPNLPQEQLVLVKNQVSELTMTVRPPPVPQGMMSGPPPPPASMAAAHPHSTPTPPMPGHHPGFPPPPAAHLQAVMPPVSVPAQAVPMHSGPPPALPKMTLSSLLGAGAMNAIMKKPQDPMNPVNVQATTTGQMGANVPNPQQKPAVDASVLFKMLRAKGMIGVAKPAPPPPKLVRNPQTIEEAARGITLTPSSIKHFRPKLVLFLYDKLGPQCSQCGRRFANDEEGRRRKTAHLDWHFKVNQRIGEAEKLGGEHRSWYVGEGDWVRREEVGDADFGHDHDGRHDGGGHDGRDGDAGLDGGAGGGSRGMGGGGGGMGRTGVPAKEQWVRVPDDARLKGSVCPICQERFEMSWFDKVQEFVWMDARVGDGDGRIWHASCWDEAFGGGGGGSAGGVGGKREGEMTVLGKRKAEDDLSSRSKIKLGGA